MLLKSLGKLPQFILRIDRHELIEVAGADGRGRFGHCADRLEDGANGCWLLALRANTMPESQAAPYQSSADRATRRAFRFDCSHVVLIDLEYIPGYGLDFAKGVVQARLIRPAKIELIAILAGAGEKFIALLAIMPAQGGQFFRPVPLLSEE